MFAKQGTYNGVQYGMPFTTSSRTLFYNKKLFAKAKITSPPTTWADISADAAKINVDSIWPIWNVLDMTPEGRGTGSNFPGLQDEYADPGWSSARIFSRAATLGQGTGGRASTRISESAPQQELDLGVGAAQLVGRPPSEGVVDGRV